MGFALTRCCFCVELRTGSLIIGYLNLIGNIVLTIVGIMGVVGGIYLMGEGNNDQEQTDGLVTTILAGVNLAFILINLMFNIFLLVGIHKHKPRRVKAYLIYASIFLIITVIVFITNLATISKAGYIARDVISIAFTSYLLLVIRSYYLSMDDSASRSPM